MEPRLASRTWVVATIAALGVVGFGFAGMFDFAASPTPQQAICLAIALVCLLVLLSLPTRAAYRLGRATRAQRSRRIRD